MATELDGFPRSVDELKATFAGTILSMQWSKETKGIHTLTLGTVEREIIRGF